MLGLKIIAAIVGTQSSTSPLALVMGPIQALWKRIAVQWKRPLRRANTTGR